MTEWDFSRAEWNTSTRSTNNGGNCVEVATVWRKSSRSTANGGDCVEVATAWRRSTRTTANGGNCVEVAATADHAVAVRDSKDRTGPSLVFAPDQWAGFLGDIRAGSFDLP